MSAESFAQFLTNPSFSAGVAIIGVVLTAAGALKGTTRGARLRRNLEDASHALQHADRPLPGLQTLSRGWAVESAGRLIHPSVSLLSRLLLAYFAVVLAIVLYIGLGLWRLPTDVPVWATVSAVVYAVLVLILAAGAPAMLFTISADTAKRAGWYAVLGYRKLGVDDLDGSRMLVVSAWASLLLPAAALVFLVIRVLDAFAVSIDASLTWAVLWGIILGSVTAIALFAARHDEGGRRARVEAKRAVKDAPSEPPEVETAPAAQPEPRRSALIVLLAAGLGAAAAWRFARTRS